MTDRELAQILAHTLSDMVTIQELKVGGLGNPAERLFVAGKIAAYKSVRDLMTAYLDEIVNKELTND